MSGLAYGAGNEFKLFIWSEYMPPEMPKAFEERTGLKMTCK
jgi:spermidine/putrescine-binding protein